MNPVVHFEFPGEDMGRMKKFYEEAFGWKMNQMGPEMNDYVVVHASETDSNNMVKNPGQINGGFYKKDPKAHAVSVVISVQDINEARKKVEAAGGKIVNGPDEIPGIGTYMGFEDTEGNRVAMLQPSPRM